VAPRMRGPFPVGGEEVSGGVRSGRHRGATRLFTAIAVPRTASGARDYPEAGLGKRRVGVDGVELLLSLDGGAR